MVQQTAADKTDVLLVEAVIMSMTLAVLLIKLAMLLASTVAITRSQLLGEAKTVLVFAITYIGLSLLVVAVYHWVVKRKWNEASIAGLLFASLEFGQKYGGST